MAVAAGYVLACLWTLVCVYVCTCVCALMWVHGHTEPGGAVADDFSPFLLPHGAEQPYFQLLHLLASQVREHLNKGFHSGGKKFKTPLRPLRICNGLDDFVPTCA